MPGLLSCYRHLSSSLHAVCSYVLHTWAAVVLQALQKAVPAEFELMGQRKGFVRYYSPALRALVKQHADALESRELALSGILQVRCLSFCSAD